MHSSFQCEIVSKDREEDLKIFFAQSDNSDGAIQLQLDHIPDFWASMEVQGRQTNVLVVYDKLNNQIAGTMIVSHKDCYFQGRLSKTVYVSGLKLGSGYEHSIVLALVFKMMRTYYAQSGVKNWFFSVFTDNKSAISFFGRNHKLCPSFIEMGRSTTHVFKKKIIPGKSNPKFEIKTATESDVDEIIRYIQSEGRTRTNLPNYSPDELSRGTGILKNFRLNDLVLAKYQTEIIGMMGLWDQTRFRRWLVKGYSKGIGLFRPLINMVAGALHYPQLPAPNHQFLYKIFCLQIIKNDNTEVFRHLFNYLMRGESSPGANYIITLTSDSPFNPFFKRKSVSFSNTLFKTGYAENLEYLNNLNLNNFYIEQGGL